MEFKIYFGCGNQENFDVYGLSMKNNVNLGPIPQSKCLLIDIAIHVLWT